MSANALELDHIKKQYPDGEGVNHVLSDVTLEVGKGEFIAIVGPSGSGKSTLLTIAGVLLSADSGNILINEHEIKAKKQRELTDVRRNELGFIFQNHQLLPFLTAEEQLIYIGKLSGKMKKQEIRQEVDKLLTELGIEDCRKKYPSQMSGGQKQRVAIARAFMNRPSIILADEPTASLDREQGRQIAEMIRKEVKLHSTAAIMVTHDERILDLVDKVYRLEEGRLCLPY